MTAPNDQEWLDTLKRSLLESVEGLPAWPSSELQNIFVGASGLRALEEAFLFYQVIRDSYGVFGKSSQILDFGVGWGRILRCFYKDVSVENLHGVDVDPIVIAEAERIGVKGDLRLVCNDGELPFQSCSMDVVYAFSVFSHLSEASAKHWLIEIMRVLKQGGLLVFTSTNFAFLDLCRACREKSANRNAYEEHYANLFEDPYAEMAKFKAGKHVFVGNGGGAPVLDGGFYGWASMPELWLRSFLGHTVDTLEYRDDGVFQQSVFIVRKASYHP